TLLAKVFARCIGCDYRRVQFTPDLLPADILGTTVWNQRDGSFSLFRGPVFTNVLLADEINRSPPKTQSALLEAMEEKQVSIEGVTHTLEAPFFVLATQNPIEQEGTYPLPEAQMDRFMFRLSTGYASSLEEEVTILQRRIAWRKDDPTEDVEPVVSREQFIALHELAEDSVYVDPQILSYVAEVVRRTREHPKVSVGSSPRGGLALLKASRALALTYGRDFVTPDDIKLIAVDTLAHRLILNIEDVLEGVSEESVVREVVSQVEVPTEFQRTP
ncbi:MAG: MoxR family ATPase, partial [Chloroflexi bacterium]|nr:MoxR family ATPase [Chloroflexota bacterium]